MKEDMNNLKSQGINTVCLVKKKEGDDLVESHIEFDAWVRDEVEHFKAIPKGEHKYDIKRIKEGKIIRYDIDISKVAKSISNLQKIQIDKTHGVIMYY